MVARKVVVSDSSGLHLRPAGMFCEISIRYQSRIQIRKGDSLVNAKSVLGVLSARVKQGDEIEIICEGPDEQEALEALVDMVTGGFGLS